MSRKELLERVGDISQVAGIVPMELQDGPDRGVRVYEVRTGGGLRFQVMADRGLDLGDAELHGITFHWRGGAGTPNPAFFDDMDWLRAFGGGLMVTGGLDAAGQRSQEGPLRFPLHGRAHRIPARATGFDARWEGEEYVLEVWGKVRQVALAGEDLLLHRRIRAYLGRNAVELTDRVENMGHAPAPHMMLYHCNLGYPLLDEETEVRVSSRETHLLGGDQPGMSALAGRGGPPTPGDEQVFCHRVVEAPSGMAAVALVNRRLGAAFALRWESRHLPLLWQWRSMQPGMYVMGLEPMNGDMRGRAFTREQGVLDLLEPGESRTYRLQMEFLSDVGEGGVAVCPW